MLYTVNVKLLRMIQNSRWIPSDVNALEKLLNTKIVGINVDTVLTRSTLKLILKSTLKAMSNLETTLTF